jgi:hypothetical protein
MSDREIAREAGVGYTLVAKLRKSFERMSVPSSSSSSQVQSSAAKIVPSRDHVQLIDGGLPLDSCRVGWIGGDGSLGPIRDIQGPEGRIIYVKV